MYFFSLSLCAVCCLRSFHLFRFPLLQPVRSAQVYSSVAMPRGLSGLRNAAIPLHSFPATVCMACVDAGGGLREPMRSFQENIHGTSPAGAFLCIRLREYSGIMKEQKCARNSPWENIIFVDQLRCLCP